MMLMPAVLGALAHQAAAGPPPAPLRALLGNRAYPPYTNTSSINHVRAAGIRITASDQAASWSLMRSTFHNLTAINGGESNGPDTFDLSLSALYANTIYPITIGGNPFVTVAPGTSVEHDPITSFSVSGGGFYHLIVRTVGAVGTLNRLISHGARSFLGEGLLAGTNPAVDYTDGSFGRGRTSGPPTIVGNNITAATITNAGTGYTGATNVIAVDPTNQAVKTVGNSNGTTVSITNGTPVAPATGWSAQTYLVHAAGGGFGQDTGVYGPAITTAVPSGSVGSVLLIGDSITRAYGSADGSGDLTGNYGIYERAILGHRGFMSMALNGNFATAFTLTNAHAKQYAAVTASGVTITDVIIALGTNDFASPANSSSASVIGAVSSGEVGGYWAARGANVYYATVPPRPGGGTGFLSGGAFETYNAAVRAGSLPYQTGFIETHALCADAADSTIWRTDGGVWSTDNIHPGLYAPDLARGIPAIAAQLILPWMAGAGVVPVSPTFVRVSGAVSGEKTVEWDAPTTLYNGDSLSLNPVTSYRLRARRVDTGALVGSSPVTVTAPTQTYNFTGLPATDLTVSVAAVNAAGESEESLLADWTGT